MEIQHGKGPWADPVAGIVPLGTTLTMVVGINDKLGNMTDILNWHLSLFMINLRLNTDWRTTVIHNFRFRISALGWLSLAASRLFANFVQKLSIAASCISCLLSPHQCDYNTTLSRTIEQYHTALQLLLPLSHSEHKLIWISLILTDGLHYNICYLSWAL